MKENTNIEFKSNFSDAVFETLSAFANTKGGKVLIGLDNNGKPLKAFTIGKESIQQWINEIKNKTQPTIIADAEILKLHGQEIVEFSIHEFPIKPVAFKSRYFKRVQNSNHVLNGSEISDLYLQSLQLSWDSYAFIGGTFKQLQIPKIKQFIKKVNESGRLRLPLDPNAALTKLKLITNTKVSNAAMILFSSHTAFYNVHVGRFKTPSLIIDDRMINGNLFDVVEEAMRFIISHLKVAFDISGKTTQRHEIFEYPITAIRELLLNSLIHRDYTSSSDVQIKIFDKKITFFNPGKLYGNINIKALKSDTYSSQTRNKLIAEAFYLTKDIEKYGSGFIRIRKEIQDYASMKFQYAEDGDGFMAELSYTAQKDTLDSISESKKAGSKVGDKVGNKVGNKVGENLSENQILIIAHIRENKFISASTLANLIGISTRKIEENIAKLKKLGILQRLGANKGGYWEL